MGLGQGRDSGRLRRVTMRTIIRAGVGARGGERLAPRPPPLSLSARDAPVGRLPDAADCRGGRSGTADPRGVARAFEAAEVFTWEEAAS